jgi:hypothetical protein
MGRVVPVELIALPPFSTRQCRFGVIRAGLPSRRNYGSPSGSRHGMGVSIAVRIIFARLPLLYEAV